MESPKNAKALYFLFEKLISHLLNDTLWQRQHKMTSTNKTRLMLKKSHFMAHSSEMESYGVRCDENKNVETV